VRFVPRGVLAPAEASANTPASERASEISAAFSNLDGPLTRALLNNAKAQDVPDNGAPYDAVNMGALLRQLYCVLRASELEIAAARPRTGYSCFDRNAIAAPDEFLHEVV